MARGLLERAIYGPEREHELVSAFLGERPGIFVEVGANDPVIQSQTLHLERRGWSGLLVEPLAEMAAALRQHRKAKVAEVACGAPAHHGTLMSFKVANTGSTLADDFTDANLVASEIRKVPVVTLDSLLEQAGFAKVDFVSIDVEGFELEVLAGFSLERYRPRLVLMEDRVRDLTRHRHMLGRGYKLVRRTGLNSWYVPAETEFPISWFGRWQILRKYRLGIPLRAAQHRRRQRRLSAAQKSNHKTIGQYALSGAIVGAFVALFCLFITEFRTEFVFVLVAIMASTISAAVVAALYGWVIRSFVR